ncbi:MAG: NUDIX hydrolase [Hyphomicrobium sp.]
MIDREKNCATGDRVVTVSACRMTAAAGGWDFAETHSAAIDRHWAVRSRDSPGFFNGTIYMLADHLLEPDLLSGRLRPVDFKSFLYWKDHGYPDAGLRDCFGSALIRSAEGHVLLGRQRAGNINAGLAYLPGGFIDARDIGSDGSIDIAGSIGREVVEETGIGIAGLTRGEGFLLTFAGPMLSMAVQYRSPLDSATLSDRIHRHIAADPGSELADVVVIRSEADLRGLAMPLYADVLLHHLFPPR